MFSLIGGGGKSSLLYYLWKLCQSENKITIATTTTVFAQPVSQADRVSVKLKSVKIQVNA